jgi:hypothetical protein
MSAWASAASDALHRRVRRFMSESVRGAEPPEPFGALACDIARLQAAHGTGIERLLAARGLEPGSLVGADDIPAMPADAFRLRRVAVHPPEDDEVVFRTSGTTSGARGEHAMRVTDTYRWAARLWGAVMLWPDVVRAGVAALAPASDAAGGSSLGFMLELFGRVLGGATAWAVDDGAVDVRVVRRAAELAAGERVPLLVAGASFAFVHLLESLDGERLALPPGSRAMLTGGLKGKSREVAPEALRADVARALGLSPAALVGEYGMTELGSQAYEGVLRAERALPPPAGEHGIYFSPPWMRVSAVDPETLLAVEPGREGLARIVDLANVDSAVAIQTADRVREVGGGFELLGRAPGSPPRGCSIGIDEILGGA